MLQTNLYLSCLLSLALAAPFSTSHQTSLHVPENRGIPQSLFNEFNDLSKIVDITNCLQTAEGLTYPFECNSFCREFPELKLIKQWNTNDDLDLTEEGSSGYIAVDHDWRKIFIVIAGSGSGSENSVTTMDYNPLSSGSMFNVCPGCKVHAGFYNEWVKIEEIIGEAVKDLVEQYIKGGKENPYQLVLVGSKFGGAVATLAAADFEAKGWNPQVTTFGQPKVGNEAFTDYLTGKFTPSTYRRVTHISDPVPQFPQNEDEFSHYEYFYFISKPFVPFAPSDILTCNNPSDPACMSPLNLDWTPNDYFHNTDNCVREAFFIISFLTFEFNILEPLTKIEGAKPGSNVYTTLEAIGKVPELDEDNGIQEQEIIVNEPDADVNTAVSEGNTKETHLIVQEPEPKLEDIRSIFASFSKTQEIWPKDAPRKRAMASDPDTDTDSVNSSGPLRNAFLMLEQEADNVLPPTEYEDEEIYHTMTGFDKAQKMWIKKPQGAASNQKIADEFFEIGMLPEESSAKEKNDPIDPVTHFTEHKPSKGLGGALNTEPRVSHANLATTNTKEESEIQPMANNTTEKKKRNLYFNPQNGHVKHLQIPVSARTMVEVKDMGSLESGKALGKRGLDRALKFFYAPKDVLDAQLAANQEAALYNAQKKAATNPDIDEAESSDPDEDYFKKGGSVLILNGRPLEVDGHPVLYSPPLPKVQPQKRSQVLHEKGNREPILVFKKGGVRCGDGNSEDKVTELQSSTPPSTGTRSDSKVGVIENTSPTSCEEEIVNVQKGRNVVFMNGRQMPPNFVQKSVTEDGSLVSNPKISP